MEIKGVNDVFSAPEISLLRIRNEIDVIGVRAILYILIADVIAFFNVGKTMNDTQVAITCDLIIDAYPHFKIEDLKLCFRNAMLLKYGNLYDRIDGSIIIGWLKEYEKERLEFAIASSENERAPAESELNNGTYYQDYLVSLKERAESGDEEAKQCLDRHLEMQSLLKSSGYEKYAFERERQRLHGRGTDYEKRFNRNLK